MADEIGLDDIVDQTLASKASLREQFKATAVDIETFTQGGGEFVRFHLEFRGFESITATFGHCSDVVETLDLAAEDAEITTEIESIHGYDHRAGETDERPSGTVTATIPTGGTDGDA